MPETTLQIALREAAAAEAAAAAAVAAASQVPAGAPPGQDGEDGQDGIPIPGPRGLTGQQGQAGMAMDGEDGADGFAIPGPPGRPGEPSQPIPGMDGEDGQDGFSLPQSSLYGAASVVTVAAPDAANSTSDFTMQGLAGSITPKRSGTILVSIAGTVTADGSTTVDNGVILQGSWGTGAAPASNDPLAGTQAGAPQAFTWPVAPAAVGDVNYGFNVIFLIEAAQMGVTLWLDLAAKAVTTVSEAPLVNVTVTAVEL